jgi:hypothetical protein
MVRKISYVLYYFVTKEHVINLLKSGEVVAKLLLYISSNEEKFDCKKSAEGNNVETAETR